MAGRDGQDCCAFVVSVDDGDDPPVSVIGPDDITGATRALHVGRFTDHTRITVWDAAPHRTTPESTYGRPLPPNALPWLRARLEPLPETYGWAGNQWCDAVHRFDGPARVRVVVRAGTIRGGYVACADPVLRAEISAVLRP